MLTLEGEREGLQEGGKAQGAAEGEQVLPGVGDGAAGAFSTSGQAESKGQGGRFGTVRVVSLAVPAFTICRSDKENVSEMVYTSKTSPPPQQRREVVRFLNSFQGDLDTAG